MIRIYKRVWQTNWAEQWQYRANLLMYLLFWLVSPIVYLAVWMTIANSQGSVKGFTANDFVTYYMVLLIVDQLTSEITIHVLAYRIQDGTLSGELLKPVHPILTTTLVNNIAFKVLTMMAFIPVWIVLALLFRPNFSAVTLPSLLIALPAVLIGFLINFLFGAAITCVAFWTTRVYALSDFYYALVVLFAGQFVPLDLMPGYIQTIARYLPFQLMRYFPIELILNRLPPTEIAFGFASGVFWLVVAVLIFRFTWREGLKRFSAVGA